MKHMQIERAVLVLALIGAKACATPTRALHLGVERPTAIAGEWIDLRHTTPGDTSLWVLRENGYDGSAHLSAAGRNEQRYGSWFLRGELADSTSRAICFAKRLGRDGASCVTFSLDTVRVDGAPRRRMVVHNYRGQHYTGDWTLIERSKS